MLIDIQNVSLSIHGEPLVYIPEWKLEGGKLYGLTGKTGSGKSTIGKWLGRIEPVYWEVKKRKETNLVRGDGTMENPVAEEEALYLLQDTYQIFNPYVPVIRHFRDIWKNCGDTSSIQSFDEIPEILESLGIADPTTLMKRKAGVVSQGEAQRLAFVLGFIRSASLRIYDEVFSNVDFRYSLRMLNFLRDFCERSETSAVVISHEYELLQACTNDIYMIQDGVMKRAESKRNPGSTPEREISGPPLLSIRDLRVPAHGPHRNNRGTLCMLATLSLYPGGRVGLFGASGLGKTTLLKGLLGEHDLIWSECKISSGKKRDGAVLRDLDIRYLPQSVVSVFNPASTLRRSLREIQEVHDVSDHEIELYLDLFGLQLAHLDQYPSGLSGGEIQRLGIISLLPGNPDIILLDESFSSVDEDTRETIWSVLKSLQQDRKFGILVVSHDVKWLRSSMDQVYEVLKADPPEVV